MWPRQPAGAEAKIFEEKANKASLYRRGRSGLYIRDEAAREIDGLQAQMNVEWRRRDILMHPETTVQFHLKNPAQDRDGTLKTVLDIMQKSGVIWDDNIAHFNGWLHIAPAVVTTQEKVVIELRETGSA